ncbi:MAG: hypothetical protein WC716_07990 [Chitinophagaceae bacterium]|jgi:hypothetical protein
MDNGKFYQIYLKPKEGIDEETITKKMNLSLDWFKYDKNNYIVWSTSDIAKWMTRLKPLAEPSGRLFICEIVSTNRNGWMNKDFWEWLKKER